MYCIMYCEISGQIYWSVIVTALSVINTPSYPHICCISLYICKKTCFAQLDTQQSQIGSKYTVGVNLARSQLIWSNYILFWASSTCRWLWSLSWCWSPCSPCPMASTAWPALQLQGNTFTTWEGRGRSSSAPPGGRAGGWRDGRILTW